MLSVKDGAYISHYELQQRNKPNSSWVQENVFQLKLSSSGVISANNKQPYFFFKYLLSYWYDGYSFTVYHHDPDDSTSLGSDNLTFIFEDSQQRLWIGTRNSGLDYFDRETGRFYHIRHTGAESLVSDKITLFGISIQIMTPSTAL